jgi:hypothetical protein
VTASVVVERSGEVRPDDQAVEILRAAAGQYRMHHSSGLVVLTADDGSGSMSRPGERLVMTGDIALCPLLAVMNNVAQNRDSGRLVAKNGRTERVVLVRDGQVASVSSNLARDRLGTFLLRRGQVTEAQIEAAQHEVEAGKKMGQVLVAAGAISVSALWSAIQEQLTELIGDTVQWTEGMFVWFKLPDGFVFPSTPPMPMQGLLLESVRREDELAVVRQHIPSTSVRLRRTNKAANPHLDAMAVAALDALEAGEMSVEQLTRFADGSEFQAMQLAYGLLKAGLVMVASSVPVPVTVVSAEDERRVSVFVAAFREIHDAFTVEPSDVAGRHRFREGVGHYLTDTRTPGPQLFDQIVLLTDGGLDIDRLCTNAASLGPSGPTTLSDVLHDLTFFMLFHAGELLPADVHDRLASRVRLIHAGLPAR